MKSKAAVLWFLISVALAAALVVQWNSARKQQLKIEQLQLQVEKGASKEKTTDARVQDLEKEVRDLTGELRATEYALNRVKVPGAAAPQAAGPAPSQPQTAARLPQGQAGPGNVGKALATMMKDPEMRKMMEQQQKLGMEMIYGSLFKELKLPPDQEKKFRDMLMSQQMDSMEQAGAMFGEEGVDRTQAAKDLATKNAKRQDEIKELLGEEKYAQYQDYNQTVSERMMVDQLAKQVDISPEQNQMLMSIISEEKKNVQINYGAPNFDPTKDWQQALQSDEISDRLFAQQEEVNKRVIERAGQVLTPDQLEKFGPLLKNQLEMQKVGIRMAREMFKSGDGGQGAAPELPVPTPVQP